MDFVYLSYMALMAALAKQNGIADGQDLGVFYCTD
jgi:hypothetical protein